VHLATRRAADTSTNRRLGFLCRRTASMEQAADTAEAAEAVNQEVNQPFSSPAEEILFQSAWYTWKQIADCFVMRPRSPSSVEAQHKQVCAQLPTYADNVALPSFASSAAVNRYLLSAKQQRVCCCGPMLRQTDGRTGGRPTYT